MDDWSEDTDSVASFFDAGRSAGAFKQASEASGTARTDRHGNAVAANGCGINPGAIVVNREIVEEETRLEIVGAIEKEVEAREEFLGVLRGEVGDDAFDGNRGINGAKFLLGGDCFGQGLASVGFVE